MELVTSKVAPVFIVGDVDIHVDDSSLATTINFIDIVSSCDLEQLVKEPTHGAGYTLDIFIVDSSTTATMSVDPPVMSKHSLITVVADVGSTTEPEEQN